MNYRGLYQFGTNQLRNSGIETYETDARILLEYVCHTKRHDLLAHPEREVSEDEEALYRALIQKRMTHVPVQHLTGVQEFMGLEFYVNQSTLVPRQDTETLVEEAMQLLHDGMEILDVCTGSGCILLSLLHYSNDCRGTGTDISGEAIALAKKNAAHLGLSATFIEGDLFEHITGKYDMIVSNPPYIKTEVIKTLMPEVKTYEPIAALDGGEDGLLFYRRIAACAKDYFYGGGKLLMEIGYDEADAVCDILEKEQYFDIMVKKDLAGLNRVVIGTFRGGNE